MLIKLDSLLRSTPLYRLRNLCSTTIDCYRSRIPFLTGNDIIDTAELLMMALQDNLINTCNNYTAIRREMSIVGVCTDRSTVYSLDTFTRQLAYSTSPIKISRFVLVNLTNKNHWEVVEAMHTGENANGYTDSYGSVWKCLETFQTRIDEKPVDIALFRRSSESDDYPPTYYAFTTYWRYELLQVLFNKLTLNLIEDETKAGHIKQPKFIELLMPHIKEGAEVDINKVAEILKTDYLDKLDDIRKEQLFNVVNKLATMEVDNTRMTTEKINNVKRDIANYQSNLQEAYLRLIDLEKQKLNPESTPNIFKEAQAILTGLANKGVLTGVKYICNSSKYLTRLMWKVRMPITYWEEDEVQQWVRYYTTRGNRYCADFVKAAFADKVLKIWFEQWITLDIANLFCSNRGSSENADNIYSTVYPPHPHIGYYNCFGNNTQVVIEALSNGDIATAMSACMNAAMQINLTDGTVTRDFVENMTGNRSYGDIACIEYKGTMYSPCALRELWSREGGFDNGTEN